MAEETKANAGAEVNEESATETKTYTADEVEKLLQAETDRRVTQAMKKAKRENEKAVREAERLASMSEEERQKEKIKELEKTLAEREREINIRENKISCIAEMEKRNIPTALVDFIVSDDADKMLENLGIFEKTLNKMVNDEVNKRLTSTSPKTGVVSGEITKEQFRKMSLSEQNELYRKDPDTYKKMML